MKKQTLKVVVLEDGRIVIEDLPVRRGQEVEVTLIIPESRPSDMPLRGLPIRYDRPFDPAVDESEWEALE